MKINIYKLRQIINDIIIFEAKSNKLSMRQLIIADKLEEQEEKKAKANNEFKEINKVVDSKKTYEEKEKYLLKKIFELKNKFKNKVNWIIDESSIYDRTQGAFRSRMQPISQIKVKNKLPNEKETNLNYYPEAFILITVPKSKLAFIDFIELYESGRANLHDLLSVIYHMINFIHNIPIRPPIGFETPGYFTASDGNHTTTAAVHLGIKTIPFLRISETQKSLPFAEEIFFKRKNNFSGKVLLFSDFQGHVIESDKSNNHEINLDVSKCLGNEPGKDCEYFTSGTHYDGHSIIDSMAYFQDKVLNNQEQQFPPIISIHHPLISNHYLVIDGNHRLASYIFGLNGYQFLKNKFGEIEIIKNTSNEFISKFKKIRSIMIPTDIIYLTNQEWTDGNEIDDYDKVSLIDVLQNKIKNYQINNFLNINMLDISCLDRIVK